jgi:hypothetical protein
VGRLLVFALLAGAVWLAANHVGISLDPRGVGTSVDGRQVVRDAGQLEATFSRFGTLDDAYMLFGGDANEHRNSLTHGIFAGLPIRHARLISARYPDFHMCKSPGAREAQSLTEDLTVVAANRAARSGLEEAIRLFHQRIRGDGERTCVRVSGAPLQLDSVRVKQNDEDITHQVKQAYARSNLVLAERIEVEDCQALLR